MDIKSRIINHNKRWNISVDTDKQFAQLRNRITGIIHRFLGQVFVNEIKTDKQFKNYLDYILGREIELDRNDILSLIDLNSFQKTFQKSLQSTQKERLFTDTYIFKEIEVSKSIKQLATVLQALFWVIEIDDKSLPIHKIVKEIKDAIELSPNTGLRITITKKRVILYPSGAKLLDEGAVNDVLDWLEKYPKVAKYFEQALKFYAEANSNEYRNLLDNLRFSIEQLLKEILKNDKSLEKQKDELLGWLKERKNHQWIINLYQQLLHYYCKYQNDAVKHDEEFSKDELEFMIYLTGTFIRFLIQPKPNE